MNLEVTLAGKTFKNPVTTASGTFGSGAEYEQFVDLAALGAVTTKGVANVPWEGNPTPRVAETYGGMLNAVGLQNPGIDLFCKRDIPHLKEKGASIIVNVCGRSTSDYVEVVERLADEPVDLLEINVSCPNVKEGGIAFGQNPDALYEITKAIKAKAKQPIVMKIDIHRRKFVLANKTGGMSGPAIKPVAVRMVYQVSHACKLPIIGMGGILTGEDAIEMMMAGATMVSVGTANFHNPRATMEVLDGMKAYMERYHIEDINEIIGCID